MWPISNYKFNDVFCYVLRKPACVWCNTSSTISILQGDRTGVDVKPDMSIFCPSSLIEIHSAILWDGERAISWAKIAAFPSFKGFYYHIRGITFCELYVCFTQNSMIAITRNFLVTNFGSEFFFRAWEIIEEWRKLLTVRPPSIAGHL